MRAIKELFSEKKASFSLFGLALAAHLAVFYALMYFYGPCVFFLSNDCIVEGNDTQHYVVIADNLAHGNGYSRFVDAPFEADALRTPLLPLYFAPFAYFGGLQLIWLAILLLNILLSLAPAVLYKLSRLFLPHNFSLAAGLCMALEPVYVYRSQIAEPDAVFVLLLLSAVFFLVRSWRENRARDLYVAFALMGLSVLAKPTGQYILMLMISSHALFVVFFARNSLRVQLRRALVALIIAAAIIAPWIFRNYSTFGVAELSSIQGYNLYEYYTANLALPDETVPSEIQQGSREPSRYLPNQEYFTAAALDRIQAAPVEYLRQHLVGTLRNLFVSDIAAIYHYSHTAILPFPYNPTTGINIHETLLRGDFLGTVSAAFKTLPKLFWMAALMLIYVFALIGWWSARREAILLLTFTFFICIYAYIVLASGVYVDAKYRLPGLPLVLIAALYGLHSMLRFNAK